MKNNGKKKCCAGLLGMVVSSDNIWKAVKTILQKECKTQEIDVHLGINFHGQ